MARKMQDRAARSGGQPRWSLRSAQVASALVGLTLATSALAQEATESRATTETAQALPKADPNRQPNERGQLSGIKIDDNDPVGSLPSRRELRKDILEFGYLLMDLSARADNALKAGDYARAAKYYAALAKAAPEKAVPFSKLCAAHVGQGDLKSALGACREALNREDVKTIDFERFIRLLMESDQKLTPEQIKDVEAVFTHLESQKAEPTALQHVRCDFALRIEDAERLERCIKSLNSSAPSDPRTLTYAWSLAMLRKDPKQAEELVATAKKSNIAPPGIQRMEAATLAMKEKRRGSVLSLTVGIVGALVIALLLAVHLLKVRKQSLA